MSTPNTVYTIKFRKEKSIIFLQVKFNEKFSNIKKRLLNYIDGVEKIENLKLFTNQKELINEELTVGFYNIKDHDNLYFTTLIESSNTWEEICVPPYEELRPLLPTPQASHLGTDPLTGAPTGVDINNEEDEVSDTDSEKSH